MTSRIVRSDCARNDPGRRGWWVAGAPWHNVAAMTLEGLHHVTAITADAPRNVDVYARAAA
jgi:hypothetical protein